ncbi:MAG: lytic transglycosylase domain-containing protein [Solirubrobacterales bacterium]
MASSSRSPALLLGLPLALLTALVVLLLSITVVFGAAAPTSCGPSEAVGDVNSKVPPRLIPLYVGAASRHGLGEKGPSVLASINEIETGFGENNTVSSAGAEGWMQFMPETWATYGVDANGDGVKDPFNAADAIYAAARYLRASGAPGDWREAIFAYNHANWYVEDVLAGAEKFAGKGSATLQAAAGSEACASSAGPAGPAVEKMVAEADRINGLELTYEYGGSHGSTPTPANGPFDCSSAVSHLLQVAGFKNPTMDTTLLISWGKAGPGRWVTIHVKPYGADAHTFLEFDASVTPASKRYWGTSSTNPNGGPGWIPESAFDAGYLSGFQPRHPPGL